MLQKPLTHEDPLYFHKGPAQAPQELLATPSNVHRGPAQHSQGYRAEPRCSKVPDLGVRMKPDTWNPNFARSVS